MRCFTTVTRECRLACRPMGNVKASDFDVVEAAGPRARRRRVRGRGHSHLARPGDARLDERRPLLRPAGRDRRGDARAHASAESSPPAPEFADGDHVTGLFGVQEHAVSDGAGVTRSTPSRRRSPPTWARSGMTGLTAYFGLLDIGRPEGGRHRASCPARPARWAASSGRSRRSRAPAWSGSRAGRRSAALIEELGFDAAIDYKSERRARRAARALPGPRRRVLRQRRRRDPRRWPDPDRRVARESSSAARSPSTTTTGPMTGPGELHGAARAAAPR